MRLFSRLTIQVLTISLLAGLCSCTSANQVLDPFYEPPAPIALQGNTNDNEISGGAVKDEKARSALQAMGTYQRQHSPQPVKPVVRPAIVRLMWIPDHLNSNGDLIPAHYYYLRVKKDQFAVSDAFEMERQLGGASGTSNVPYIYKGTSRLSK